MSDNQPDRDVPYVMHEGQMFVATIDDARASIQVSNATFRRYLNLGMPGKTRHGYCIPAIIRWYIGHKHLQNL